MNKYKLQVTPENGMYRGRVLQDGQIVFESDLCRDSFAATRAINMFVGQKKSPILVQNPSNQPANIVPMNVALPNLSPGPSSTPMRRCCGRG